MGKPYYVFKSPESKLPYAIQMSIGDIKNCNCSHLGFVSNQYGSYHRKSCASRSNYNLKYKLSLGERLKSKFQKAQKIYDFHHGGI